MTNSHTVGNVQHNCILCRWWQTTAVRHHLCCVVCTYVRMHNEIMYICTYDSAQVNSVEMLYSCVFSYHSFITFLNRRAWVCPRSRMPSTPGVVRWTRRLRRPSTVTVWGWLVRACTGSHSDCVGMAGEGLHRVTLQWAQLLLVQNFCPQTLLWCPKDTKGYSWHSVISYSLCSVGTACDTYKPDTHLCGNSFSPVEVTTDYCMYSS